ncbi:YsnF/AvaK domain-containing protein [Candidatus Nitrosocosmicus sp. FF01]|uniref:YsnF/AvaK domain-containing protein n=1 Tax=Candidatus Nitrosocosmicus sp. FF01 TaxID=3397670 RepID=UPI0039EC9151
MSSTINWNDVIKREARGSNDEDFGEVQDISNGYVFVQKGMINKQKFFIPQEKAKSYDGDILRFSVSRDDAMDAYQGDDFPTSFQNRDQGLNLPQSDPVTIPLVEERLDVKKRVEESQATIIKVPLKETKTIQVEVTHEEVSFETRQPTGDTSTSQEPVRSRQVIEIPLKREEVVVSKTPYIREEVVVKKKPVTETREFTEEIASEQVDAPPAIP